MAHLQIFPEKFVVGLPVAATQTIPQGSELAVIKIEVEMMHGVASGTVDNGIIGNVFTIVNEHGPDVDEDEEGDVSKLLEGEDEGEHMVGQALSIAVQWMKGMRCIRCRHDPLMVGLVEVLVDGPVV
jgi:hypothetical protein